MERKILIAISLFSIITCVVLIVRECDHYVNDSIKIDTLEKERQKIRQEKDSLAALYHQAISKINHDSVYQRIEISQKNDIEKFNNRVHDIVGMAINGTIMEIEANISKGDSIRAGHLNLVNPR
jgi:hypothetical protein